MGEYWEKAGLAKANVMGEKRFLPLPPRCPMDLNNSMGIVNISIGLYKTQGALWGQLATGSFSRLGCTWFPMLSIPSH
jgi:hypothetical protein